MEAKLISRSNTAKALKFIFVLGLLKLSFGCVGDKYDQIFPSVSENFQSQRIPKALTLALESVDSGYCVRGYKTIVDDMTINEFEKISAISNIILFNHNIGIKSNNNKEIILSVYLFNFFDSKNFTKFNVDNLREIALKKIESISDIQKYKLSPCIISDRNSCKIEDINLYKNFYKMNLNILLDELKISPLDQRCG